MQAELVQIRAVTGKTIIFVTHDIVESVLLADRIVVLTTAPGQIKKIVSVDPRAPARAQIRGVYDWVFELEQLL